MKKCIPLIWISFSLFACGGSGGDEAPVAELRGLAGLNRAEALIVTGGSGARLKSHGVECQNDDGDSGFFVSVNGEEICQAYFEAETLYAIDADGVRARVRYLDAQGLELDRQDYRPEYIFDAGDESVVADFFFNDSSPGAATDVQTVIANKNSGSVYKLPRVAGRGGFETETLTAFELLEHRAAFWSDRLVVDGGRLLFVHSAADASSALFEAGLAGGGDVVGSQVSPTGQIANSFVTALAGNRLMFLRGGGTGESWVALDAISRAFEPIGTPALTGGSAEERWFQDSIYANYFRGPDGLVYLGSVYFDDGAAAQTQSRCVARVYRLTISPDLEVGATQVAESSVPRDASSHCQTDLFQRRYFSMIGNRWLAIGANGDILELTWSGGATLRFSVISALADSQFVIDDNTAFNGSRYAVVATPESLFMLGKGAGDPENRLYVTNVSDPTAADGRFVDFGSFEALGIQAFVGDSIVMRATDKSNGDSVLLQVFADGSRDELSRNDDIEIVAIERLN